MRVIVYDCEIEKAIPDRSRPLDHRLQYCNGWGDKKGMGISVIAAVDVATAIPRVFLRDNLPKFAEWTKGAMLVGHSNHQFDDELLRAHSLWTAGASWDILRKLRKAVGEGEEYRRGTTLGGRTVNDCARVNLNGLQKSDDGAMAPLLWQQGKVGELVDYCLRDVMLEYQLFLRRGSFVDPVTSKVFVLDEPVMPLAPLA